MSSTLEEPRTYGNFRRPKNYVLGSLGMLASIAVIVSCIVFVLMMFFVGIPEALVFFVLAGVTVVMLIWKDRHQRSTLENFAGRAAWTKAKAKGENIYRSGIMGDGSALNLPGLLDRTEVFPCTDNMLRQFGLLRHGRTNDFTVVLKASPNGYILTDPHDLEITVDRWNRWMVTAAHEPGLRQVQVTIETRPDHGQALRREISAQKSPFAPPQLAVDIMNDISATYPAGSATVNTYIALTFAGSRRGRTRSLKEMSKQIASRLPALTKELPNTGAGPVTLMDEIDLAMMVRQAYNPSDTDIVAEAEALGQSPRELVTVWRAAGPTAWDEYWDHFRHDSGVSATWAVTGVNGAMLATTIQPLLAANEEIPVKRVSILLRPKSPDQSAIMAEKDRRNAKNRVNNAKVASSRAENELVSADAAAQAEAQGAALVDYSVLVTATDKSTRGKTPEENHTATLEDATAAVDSLIPAVRFQARRIYGSQPTAFAMNLPLGLIAEDHSSVPTTIREGL